jgi:hypothetical protein
LAAALLGGGVDAAPSRLCRVQSQFA